MTNKINIQNFVALLALLFAAFVTVGCAREAEQTTLNEPTTTITLPISVDTKATATEVATDSELAIHTLRVYAFTGGNFAGHYYYSGDAVSKISFLLDLKLYSSATQSVTLYAIANETSFLRYSNITSLSASTSEAELKSLYFSHLDVKSGLPMFYASASPIDLNVADDAAALPENVVNAPEHEGHTVLAQSVSLQVKRAISKIEIFATKQPVESAELRITGVRADKRGIRLRNFLMPQSIETLQALAAHDTDQVLELTSSPVTVSTTLPAAYTSASEAEKQTMRTDKANYTALLATPYYAFENPYGSNNPLVAEADGKGAVLHIDYEFNGVARSAQVNMPALERNTHYPVYCLFNNEGKMHIDYIVAPWEENEENKEWGEIEFDYPTYSNPILPLDDNAVRPFAKPEMWYTGGTEEGAFCCRFIMWAPIGQEWTAMVDAPSSDYEVRVYDKNGEPQPNATVTVLPGLMANDWYTIKVVPLRNLKVSGEAEQVKLHIVYTPSWMHHADYLLINGEQESPAYLDSGSDSETIVITQIEQP
jgi:hypothetical protein